MHHDLLAHWPLFGLRVVTPRLELRYVDDDLAGQLAVLAAGGIHDPATMPFAVPWTDVAPPRQQANTLQYYWHTRAGLGEHHWDLPFAVLHEGVVVGTTSVIATDFSVLRSFETGSWLGAAHQRQGFGKEMRLASLHLGFAGFGAEFATTGAFSDNAASLGVTRSLGYTEIGRRRVVRRGSAATTIGFHLERAVWEQRLRTDDVRIHGLELCLGLLGLA